MSQGEPVGAGELARDREWQRLDPRMLLVHPIREVGRFIIPLTAFFVAGTATENPWQYLTIVVPIGLGLARYLTTSFRISGERVELRRGLLSRHVLSTPLDRVRTVDLSASPIHRILGLTTVRVGTGTASTSQDERLDLDGLPAERARRLRSELLRVTPVEPGREVPAPGAAVEFEASWLRFAPFTSSGLVIAAALIGGGSQLLGAFGVFEDLEIDTRSISVPGWLVVLLVVAGVVGLLVAAVVLSVIGYLITNWAFRLTHSDGAWHVSRGLLTTRETSLDDERVAGVSVGEPLGLRAAGGRRLNAIATGLRATQQGSSALVPPSPRAVVERAAVAVIGREAPVVAPLVEHGPAARRRRFSRALTPALLLAIALLALVVGGWAPWWLLVTAVLALAAAAGLAVDRSRALGHRLVDGYVVARSGSLLRSREVLNAEHVIGWTFRATWWQRRVGLTTLIATTAGGPQAVTVLDVAEPVAVELAAAGVPGLVDQFRAEANRQPAGAPERVTGR